LFKASHGLFQQWLVGRGKVRRMGNQSIGELFKECVMKSFKQSLVNFLKSEDGPTAVEYAVMVALIIVVAIGAVTLLGQKTSETFNNVATAIPSGS
jgi:pilus assembly protein Flp/PilA